MERFNLKGRVTVPGGNIDVGLILLSFMDGNVNIVYCAELDLSGSGYDFNEAKASFWEALSEFIRYGMSKGTLWKELKRLGWKIKGGKKNTRVSAPQFQEMMDNNEEFKDIILNRDFQKITERVQLPQLA